MKKTTVNTEDETMCCFVLEIARTLVDQEDDVRVDLSEENATTILNLRVAQSEVGKIIGKQGRMAKSLRIIVFGVGTKLHKRYYLNILRKPSKGGD